MSYDNWKLSNPDDDGYYTGMVNSCCGAEGTYTRFIDDEYITVCLDCGEAHPERIEKYEYDEIQRENYYEFNRDE